MARSPTARSKMFKDNLTSKPHALVTDVRSVGTPKARPTQGNRDSLSELRDGCDLRVASNSPEALGVGHGLREGSERDATIQLEIIGSISMRGANGQRRA